MTIIDFSKKLIDLKNRINSNSDDFNQKVVDLESKVTRHSNNIKKLQGMTNQIEQQLKSNMK